MNPDTSYIKPSIHELGIDLMELSTFKLLLTIFTPFIFLSLYFLCAFSGYWIPAVFCAMALSFFTYGSTSHDLVHKNLKINSTFNEVLLTIIELMCFRSGHAYRASHLYHHKRYPHEDDIEGSASRMTLVRALVEGVIFQFKLYFWALRNCRDKKQYWLIIAEGIAVVLLAAFCIYSTKQAPVYFIYFLLMVSGSWIIPLVTSYVVHTPHGASEWQQTRLFRGTFFSMIAFEHLYHLEHHLYPMVPHKNWVELAKRLDPYFRQHHIVPIVVELKSKKIKSDL